MCRGSSGAACSTCARSWTAKGARVPLLLDRQEVVEAGDLEQALHLGRDGAHGEPATLRLRVAVQGHECTQAARVDEADVGQVEDQGGVPVVDEPRELALDVFRRDDVQIAGQARRGRPARSVDYLE